jgi:hypothetical protein
LPARLIVPPAARLPPLLVAPPVPLPLVEPPVATLPPLLIIPPLAFEEPPVVPPVPDFAPLASSSLEDELPPHPTAAPKTKTAQAPTIDRAKVIMLSP